MGVKGSEASESSAPLLSTNKDGVDFHEIEQSEDSQMTFMLVFTAVSATIGSYVFGYAVSDRSHILVHHSSESPLMFLLSHHTPLFAARIFLPCSVWNRARPASLCRRGYHLTSFVFVFCNLS